MNPVRHLIPGALLPAFIGLLTLTTQAQQPTAAERAAALKANLEAGQVILRHYEWVETTVVSVDGNEKSRKQERCFYGADGTLTKVTLNQSAPAAEPRGPMRRRIAENRKEATKEYMENAVGLVKAYMPPDPRKIQVVKESGNLSINILDPGKRARLSFQNYLKPGDTLSLDVDLTNNQPLAARVATLLDGSDDSVTLDVTMGRLDIGAAYPANTTLTAPSKNLTVTVQRSGYKKASASF